MIREREIKMCSARKPFNVGVYLDTSRQYGRETAMGIANYVSQHGHWNFVVGGDVTALEDQMRKGALDGIIARIADVEMAQRFSHFNIPVVDTYGQIPFPHISSVECDSEKISYMAADFFLRRRYFNFAFVGYSDSPFSQSRLINFKNAVSSQAENFYSYAMDSKYSNRMSRALLQPDRFGAPPDVKPLVKFLKKLPPQTAVFCANDARAYHVTLAAQLAGIPMPSGLSILGVDNDPIVCAFAPLSLSSIDPNAQRVGFQGARLLEALMREARQMKGKDVEQKTRHRMIPPRAIVPRSSTDFDPIEPAWLRTVIRYVREHLADGINATDTFAFAGVSHTKLESAFKTAMGCSPHKYLTNLRMTESLRLLRETNYSIREIAKMTGFASAQYFNRQFTDAMKMTPGSWREQNQSL